MSVTITRTAWIDDDGTGTTGTVLNNAVKTSIYNEIDGALAKVAQLAGGNSFAGNQTITGVLTVPTVATHAFSGSGTGLQQLTIANGLAGSGNGAVLYINTDVASQTILASWSSTYTTAGYNVAAGTTLLASGIGGLSMATATGNLRFYTSSTERFRIATTGEVIINAVAPVLACKASVVADLGVNQGLGVQNTNPANSGTFALFANSAGTVAGSIVQTGATTVTYATTSDHRLKHDLGPAVDVAALRAVVVHDFTWQADGRRDRGVFAQDVHALYPGAVVAGTDETTEAGDLARPWMTDYSKFVADLIVGWQHHDADLAALRAELATLKGSADAQ